MDFVGFNAYLAAIESGPTLTWLGDTWLAQAWRDLGWYDRWCGFASGGPPGPKRLVRRSIGVLGRTVGLFSGRVPRTFAPVAAISQFVLDDLRGTGAPVPPETRVIPIALHSEFFDGSGAPVRHGGRRTPALRALFVGRLEMLKGPDTAIRALAEAVRLCADVRLTLAGLQMDETLAVCQQLAAELGVADRITWAGTPSLRELIALYRDHDVFLFPSRILEGLGVVNCEALACGLPIIGTAHSGSADVIIPGRTGFRVDKDDAAAMGRHLADLQADRGLLERLSAAVPDAARRFAPAEVLRLLETELTRVTEKRGPQ
jgi:glycosyltransferase involved in cell wall biosynthesis